jgi:mannose-6-phosphate isomerase-like protein (cupin superfamily)
LSDGPTHPLEKIDKPWGYELLWAKTDQYVAKLLFVKAGESLSLQYHRIKEETMFMESGNCLLETGPDENHLRSLKFITGERFHIPPGTLHRLTAQTDCRIFEVSTPHLADVVRLKDKYGRR